MIECLNFRWVLVEYRRSERSYGALLAGICTTQDVDLFFRHMNNARYIRELDFARFHFYDLSGLYRQVVKMKGNALQGASSIRYRRTIPIFSLYRIDTKVSLVQPELASWGWALLEKPPVAQPLKNFPIFYGSRKLITVFTRALHWSLS
jgi:hypothetical protein